MTRHQILAALGAALCLAAVADPADRLRDPAKEARARALFREIRCVVCQGESIDESSAPLADDLRRLVRGQVQADRSDAAIRAYLEARYGPFVLLRPRFSPTNALLWASPFAVAVIGAGLLLFRSRRGAPEGELSADEEARLAQLQSDRTD